MCGEDCQAGPVHAQAGHITLHSDRDVSRLQECGLLARLEPRPAFPPDNHAAPHPAMGLVNIVRLLRLPVTNPTIAGRVNRLMDHRWHDMKFYHSSNHTTGPS